jgi:hypothetical protein
MSTATKDASRTNGKAATMKNSEFSVEKITPKDAERMLAANSHNRNLRPRLVARLAGAMQRGEWQFNGETIKISKAEDLLDGQHRLAAIVASKTTQTMLVIRNLPESVQETIDIGSARSLGDMLKLRGEHDNAWLAAALRNLWKYLQWGSFQERFLTPTPQELGVLLDEHSALRSSIPHVRRLRTFLPVPPGPFTALHYLFSRADPVQTSIFFESLAYGENLLPTDPVLSLRNGILRSAQSARRPSGVAYSAWTIKAFNATRSGGELALMRWSPSTEKFPRVDGLDLEAENSEFSDPQSVIEALAQVAP